MGLETSSTFLSSTYPIPVPFEAQAIIFGQEPTQISSFEAKLDETEAAKNTVVVKKKKKSVTFREELVEYAPFPPSPTASPILVQTEGLLVGSNNDDMVSLLNEFSAFTQSVIHGDVNPIVVNKVRAVCLKLSDELRNEYSSTVGTLRESINEFFKPIRLEMQVLAAIRTADGSTQKFRSPNSFDLDCREVLERYELATISRLHAAFAEGSLHLVLPDPIVKSEEVRVEDIFRSVDMESFGNFTLLVDTPQSQQLRPEHQFIAESNTTKLQFPVEFRLPPTLAASNKLQESYRGVLNIVSSKLPLAFIVSQLSFQLKFNGIITNVLYIQRLTNLL